MVERSVPSDDAYRDGPSGSRAVLKMTPRNVCEAPSRPFSGVTMPKGSLGRGHRERRFELPSILRRIRALRRSGIAASVGAVVIVGLAGCDGGPGFGTRVVVINECRVDVAIAFSHTPSSPPDQDTSQKIDRLNAGQTDEWLLRPLKSSGPTAEYLWVAIPGASMWGSPTEVDIGELPLKDDSEVRGARVLRIAGDLCPS